MANATFVFSVDAWLVVDRCAPFWKDEWPFDEAFGSTNIPPEAVKIANKTIPFDFDDAVKNGFLKNPYRGISIDKRTFDQCRQFLNNASETDEGIGGSY